MPRYNHMFTIAFTVVTENDAENVTAAELREGLQRRLKELRVDGDYDEIIEACALPEDTYIEENQQ